MRVFFAISIVLAPLVAGGDVVHLKDGTKLEGDVKKSGDVWQVTDSAGKVTKVSAERVRSIEVRQPMATDPAVGMARLASLRRSVEALSDIAQIITRYERFVAQHDATPAGDEARQDLQMWRQRLDGGMVKVGAAWVTPEERADMREKSQASAEQARQLMQQDRLRDAEPMIERALAVDPENVTALFLRALLLYRQDQIPAARKVFEAVHALAPDHAPTLNNLAVIQWRQSQHAGALNQYDKAMQASPGTRAVLDNVAEALHALPKANRDTAAARRAAARFDQQDPLVQEKLAKEGQYRWGATWVDQEQLDRLREQEEEINEKLEELEEEYLATGDRITYIDRTIEDNQRSLRQLEAQSYWRDEQGKLHRMAIPSIYYDILRDNQRLERERVTQVAKLDVLRRQAKQVAERVPLPKFTGVQQLMGPEAAPVPLAPLAPLAP